MKQWLQWRWDYVRVKYHLWLVTYHAKQFKKSNKQKHVVLTTYHFRRAEVLFTAIYGENWRSGS